MKEVLGFGRISIQSHPPAKLDVQVLDLFTYPYRAAQPDGVFNLNYLQAVSLEVVGQRETAGDWPELRVVIRQIITKVLTPNSKQLHNHQ